MDRAAIAAVVTVTDTVFADFTDNSTPVTLTEFLPFSILSAAAQPVIFLILFLPHFIHNFTNYFPHCHLHIIDIFFQVFVQIIPVLIIIPRLPRLHLAFFSKGIFSLFLLLLLIFIEPEQNIVNNSPYCYGVANIIQ